MRIIAGKLRGLKLADVGEGDAAAHLRPSSDRARETMFSILSQPKYGHAPRDRRVLDIFAGTGALGLEALSRGAAHATLIDQGKIAHKLIRQNIKLCRAEVNTTLITHDATKMTINQGAPYDLIFIDPPYSMGLGELAIASAINGGWLADDALVMWEEETTPKGHAKLRLIDRRKSGRATLNIYEYKG